MDLDAEFIRFRRRLDNLETVVTQLLMNELANIKQRLDQTPPIKEEKQKATPQKE